VYLCSWSKDHMEKGFEDTRQCFVRICSQCIQYFHNCMYWDHCKFRHLGIPRNKLDLCRLVLSIPYRYNCKILVLNKFHHLRIQGHTQLFDKIDLSILLHLYHICKNFQQCKFHEHIQENISHLRLVFSSKEETRNKK